MAHTMESVVNLVGGEEEEEETLEKYFGSGKFTVGDTAQLSEACLVVKQFIAQELW